MDSSNYTFYNIDGIDSRAGLEKYFSDKEDMVFREDSLIFPIENIIKTFTDGHVKGELLIDLSVGAVVHHLFTACEFFKHIIVLKMRDRCIMELKRWVDSRTGAFDWGHAAKHHADHKGISDLLQDKEGKVKLALQHIVKCDLEKENIMEPMVLPPADCIISALLLDFICRNQDDYLRYLRKFSRLLKPGGQIILFGFIEATYVTVGKDKIHLLSYDEDCVRKTLVDAGFIIDTCKVKKRTVVSDLTDYKNVLFIVAHKEKEL
ncbi:nicotinamide N-methyltransferase-like [Dendrobates tinctorius]|uniref:nicotinamide N-methyltransferase-like n=1 Tax=Dendrobates tinctorius TaxID=92724 RepID=UPI003CCA5029